MTTSIDPVQTFKILVVGDPDVGKTSLMNRLVHDVFNNRYTATIGVDFKIATMKIAEYTCRIQIWDTAGQERYRAMTSNYYRDADGIVIVYDVTSADSFISIQSRLGEIEFHCEGNIPKILVGNKNDVDQQAKKVVSTQHGQEFAQRNNLFFLETSVKDNRNITEVFSKMTTMALQQRLGQGKRSSEKIKLDNEPLIKKPAKNRCCFM